MLPPLSGRASVLPKLRVQSHWSLILGLTIWSLAAIFLPRQFPGWPLWLHWLTATIAGLLLLGSAIGHELAHLHVARRLGVRSSSGGTFVEWRGDARVVGDGGPRDLVFAALAGPALSLALGLGLWLGSLAAWQMSDMAAAVMAYAAVVNLFLALGNVLPFLPLDGGWVLSGMLWSAQGDRERAEDLAVAWSQGAGAVIAGVGVLVVFAGGLLVGAWTILGGLVLLTAARASSKTTGGAERDQSSAGPVQPRPEPLDSKR